MKLFVNDEEVTIHNGARVLDVMRGYYMARNKKLPRKLPISICRKHPIFALNHM